MTQIDIQSAEPRVNDMETRGAMVSLYARGMISEAKAYATTIPGMTDGVWTSMERMLNPVRSFVLDGTLQYPAVDNSTEYTGLPVPEPETPPLDGDGSDITRSQEKTEPGPEHALAADLIARAKEAETEEDLNEIARLAEGRVTVLDAVEYRREELKG